MEYAVGMDIGGTKISLVLGTEKGRILVRREIPTVTGSGTKACIKNLVAHLKTLIGESGISPKKILGIGVGCPGAVNAPKGTLPRSPNLPGWAGIPLKLILKKATGLPVFLANDANTAALGENVFGEGRGVNDFIYITVSTGVGGGLVLDGKLYAGPSFVAGEIGHMSIVPDGDPCPCGKRGCLEAYASGTAIAKSFLKSCRSSSRKLSAKEVHQLAMQGNQQAVKSYERAGYYLGIGIANLLNLLNPRKVILGGGVLRSVHPVFWRTLKKSAGQHAWPEAFKTVQIVRSKLIGRSGHLGALALVFKNQRP